MQKTAAKKSAGTATPVFNETAAQAFDLDAEVRQVWQMFPGTRDKVYFIDLLNDRLVYPDNPGTEQELNEKLRDNYQLWNPMREFKDARASCCLRLDGKRYILLYADSNPSFLWERFMPLPQINSFTIDHEVAHAAIRDATSNVDPNLAECIADAYATMRHFQRYGAHSTTIDGLADWRAARFVFAPSGNETGRRHFTSPVVEQVIARRHDIDWTKLDPQETADLARRLALMYAPHRVLLERMDGYFQMCKPDRGIRVDPKAADFTRLAHALESEDFPPFLKYGAKALQFFAAEVDAVPDLRQARLRIGRRAERLAGMDEVLVGVPAKAHVAKRPKGGGYRKPALT